MSLEEYRRVPAIRTGAGNFDNLGHQFNSHLQELQGVGPVFERKLMAAGIENIDQLARQNDIMALTTALLGLCHSAAETRSMKRDLGKIKQFPGRAKEFLAAQVA